MDKERQLEDFFGFTPPPEKDKEKPTSLKSRGIKEAMMKNPDFKSKLRFIPQVLSKKERYLILIFLLIILGSLVSIPITTYRHFTQATPDRGGSFREGVVGEPRHINPLLSQTDADRDLAALIYSGLLKYNEEGKLVPDLVKSYEISSDELNYTVYLRENAKWHDGVPVTADDILFTTQTAQNADYGSIQRMNWQGVDTEKANDHTVVFKLKNKYAQFLNNLTIHIIPKHLWENVKPINFALSELNLKPLGSGPYKFKKLQKDTSGRIRQYELGVNKDFYGKKPFIEKIQVKFYESEDEMIQAYNKNEVQNLGFISSKNLKKLKFKQRLTVQKLKMPRYFGIFFNQNQSKILSDKTVRRALNQAANKETLVQKILDGNGIVIHFPLLEEILEINGDVKKYDANPEAALKLLKEAGWDKKDEQGILLKKEEKLSLRLTTSTWPELVQVAETIKEQWQGVGVEIILETLPTPELQQVIKERSYQMLLFGEILHVDPDPFSLWHSSQKRDPGLNLALYDNKAADTLLEEARQTLNPLERAKKYDAFQKLVIEDVPAIFLYSPFYLYGQTKKIKGFGNQIISIPSDRFSNIENWHIKTKRVWR